MKVRPQLLLTSVLMGEIKAMAEQQQPEGKPTVPSPPNCRQSMETPSSPKIRMTTTQFRQLSQVSLLKFKKVYKQTDEQTKILKLKRVC